MKSFDSILYIKIIQDFQNKALFDFGKFKQPAPWKTLHHPGKTWPILKEIAWTASWDPLKALNYILHSNHVIFNHKLKHKHCIHKRKTFFKRKSSAFSNPFIRATMIHFVFHHFSHFRHNKYQSENSVIKKSIKTIYQVVNLKFSWTEFSQRTRLFNDLQSFQEAFINFQHRLEDCRLVKINFLFIYELVMQRLVIFLWWSSLQMPKRFDWFFNQLF